MCESSLHDAESTPPTHVDNLVGNGEQSPNSGCRSGVCTKANMFSAEKSQEHNYSFRKMTFYLTVRLEKSSHSALTSNLKIALHKDSLDLLGCLQACQATLPQKQSPRSLSSGSSPSIVLMVLSFITHGALLIVYEFHKGI